MKIRTEQSDFADEDWIYLDVLDKSQSGETGGRSGNNLMATDGYAPGGLRRERVSEKEYKYETTVYNLEGGIAYFVIIEAKNMMGWGDPTDEMKVQAKSVGPPDTVRNVKFETGFQGSTYLSVTFNRPEHDGGSLITHYIVEASRMLEGNDGCSGNVQEIQLDANVVHSLSSPTYYANKPFAETQAYSYSENAVKEVNRRISAKWKPDCFGSKDGSLPADDATAEKTCEDLGQQCFKNNLECTDAVGFKPETRYKIQIRAVNTMKLVSAASEAVFKRTVESPPPRKVVFQKGLNCPPMITETSSPGYDAASHDIDAFTEPPCGSLQSALAWLTDENVGSQKLLVQASHEYEVQDYTFQVPRAMIVGEAGSTSTTVRCTKSYCFSSGQDTDKVVRFASQIKGITFVYEGQANTTKAHSGGIMIISGTKDTVKFEDVVFRDGRAQLGGAVLVIVNPGTVEFGPGTVFEKNRAERYGGALAILSSADVLLEEASFRNNSAASGGAIAILPKSEVEFKKDGIDDLDIWRVPEIQLAEWTRSRLRVENTSFSEDHTHANKIGGFGGAIYMMENDIVMSDSRFTACYTDDFGWGGAFRFLSSDVEITSTTFEHCEAGKGGALDCLASRLGMKGGTVLNDNTAIKHEGGGMHALFCKCELKDVSMQRNTAVQGRGGGAFFGYNSRVVMERNFNGGKGNSVVSENVANMQNGRGGLGGGIYLDRVKQFEMSDYVVKDNIGHQGGGGLASFESRDVEFRTTRFEGNTALAKRGGGGMLFDMGTMQMSTTQTASGNTDCPDDCYFSGRPRLENVAFRGNHAPDGGGGAVYWMASPFLMGSVPLGCAKCQEARGGALVEFTYGDASYHSYGNKAHYGNFTASEISTLAVFEGPLRQSFKLPDMARTREEKDCGAEACPKKCSGENEKGTQCENWRKWETKSRPFGKKAEERSGETFRNPWKVQTLDYYNQLVTSRPEVVEVTIASKTEMSKKDCNALNAKTAIWENTTSLPADMGICRSISQGENKHLAIGGVATFDNFVILARPSRREQEEDVVQRYRYEFAASKVTSRKSAGPELKDDEIIAGSFPSGEVELEMCTPGRALVFGNFKCMRCSEGRYTSASNNNFDLVKQDTGEDRCTKCPSGYAQNNENLGHTGQDALMCKISAIHIDKNNKATVTHVSSKPGVLKNGDRVLLAGATNDALNTIVTVTDTPTDTEFEFVTAEGYANYEEKTATGELQIDPTYCKPCPSGTIVIGGDGEAKCVQTILGEDTNGTTGNSQGTECPRGKYGAHKEAPVEDAQLTNGIIGFCEECPAGWFNTNTRQIECNACPGGYFSSKNAAIECNICPSGKITGDDEKDEAKTECDQNCPTGKFKSDKDVWCRNCPSGYSTMQLPGERSRAGEAKCTECPNGRYSVRKTREGEGGSTSPSRLQINGTDGTAIAEFCNGELMQDKKSYKWKLSPHALLCTCTFCPAGYYGNNSARADASKCDACANGKYASTDEMGVVGGSATCTDCQNGRYREYKLNTGETAI